MIIYNELGENPLNKETQIDKAHTFVRNTALVEKK
jgi:hypothetical protein